jgi:hypothetical protein
MEKYLSSDSERQAIQTENTIFYKGSWEEGSTKFRERQDRPIRYDQDGNQSDVR